MSDHATIGTDARSVPIYGRIAPEHAAPDLVPRYAALPEWVGWMLSLVSSIGGIFLGVALAPSSSPSQVVVKTMAQACAANDAAACNALALKQAPPTWQLWLGCLLFVVAIVGYVLAHSSATAKRAKAATRAPASATVDESAQKR